MEDGLAEYIENGVLAEYIENGGLTEYAEVILHLRSVGEMMKGECDYRVWMHARGYLKLMKLCPKLWADEEIQKEVRKIRKDIVTWEGVHNKERYRRMRMGK